MNSAAVLSPDTGWILLALLSVVWIALGYLWGKKAKSVDEFMLAGRNVGLALGTATAMATWITSNTTMLAPQFALQLGVWGMIAYASAAFGLLLFAPLASRIRDLMPGGFTSGDFIRLRYGRVTWICFLLISIFYSFTWLVSMSMAGGILLEALSGIPYVFGLTVILTVCVGYTVMGGLFAVIGTDFIQSIIVLVGIVVVGWSVIDSIHVSEVYDQLRTKRPALLDVLLPASIMALFNNLLFGIGEIFHSNVWWSRAFAMGAGVGKKAYLLSGILWFPVPIAAGFIALSSGTLEVNIPSPDMVGPLVAAEILGGLGAAVVFIVVFCSLASSIDSLLAATADLITEDIYRKCICPEATGAQTRTVGTMVIVMLGVFAWLVAYPRIGTLATVLFFAGPLVASTIWPIGAGLYWRQTNGSGALLAMLLGSTFGLTAYFWVGWYAGSLVAAFVSMMTVIFSTKFWPENFSWEALNEQDIERTL